MTTESHVSADEQRQLDRIRQELLSEFGARLSPTVIDARFDEIVRDFDRAPVRAFVPVLARRRVRQLLVTAAA